MKVRLLVGRAGNRFAQRPGDIIEVSEHDGLRMIKLGRAVTEEPFFPETPQVETAALESGEREVSQWSSRQRAKRNA